MSTEISELLKKELPILGLEVRETALESLRGAITSAPPELFLRPILQIADDLSEMERVHLIIHSVSHVVLDHLNRARIILEPVVEADGSVNLKKPLTDVQKEEHLKADQLVQIVLANQLEQKQGEVEAMVSDTKRIEKLRVLRRIMGSRTYPFIGDDRW